MCDLSVVKEFPHLVQWNHRMKQWDLKLPRFYSTVSTSLVYKSNEVMFLGLSTVSIWTQKDKKLRRKWLQYDRILVNTY
jgi:hypothetical protein